MDQEAPLKKKRKWYWKVLRIFLWVLGSFVSLVLLAWLLVVIFQNKIEQRVISRVNQELNTEIKVDDIDVSLFHHFPNVSVVFNGVSASDATPEKSGTLFAANWISLEFDLIDIITGDYTIRQIGMSQGNINLQVFADGSDNFHLLKPDTTTSSDGNDAAFHLEKLYFTNVAVSYSDVRSKQKYRFFFNSANASGNFTADEFGMKFSSDLKVDTIETAGLVLIPGAEARVNAVLNVNTLASTVTYSAAEIRIADVLLLSDGKVEYDTSKQMVDISVHSDKTDLNEFISLLPKQHQAFFKEFSHKGVVSIAAKVKGHYGNNQMPAVDVDVNLQNGFMEQNENDISLSNISFKGHFSCSDFGKESTWIVLMKDFSAQMDGKSITGSLQIKDFSFPQIKLQAKGDLELNKIKEWGGWSDITTMSGNVKFDIQFFGKIKDFAKVNAKDFIDSKSQGTVLIENAQFCATGMEKTAAIKLLDASFSNTDLNLNRFDLAYGSSDFSGSGFMKDFLPYLFAENANLRLKADIHSNNLVVNDLFPDSDSDTANNSTIRFVLPDAVVAMVDFSADKLSYNKFGASKVKARVHLNNNRLLSENVSMNTLGGSIAGEGSCDTRTKDKVIVSCDAKLKNLDVREAFIVFNNFGQEDLTYDNLRGKATVSLQFKTVFSETLEVDPASIVASAEIEILNGQLVGYAPINDLQEIIKDRDFSDIQFEKLSSNISIGNKKINIPKTEIRSNVMNMKISGTHSFENEIEYHLEVKYADVKKPKTNNNSPEDEYGYVKDDGVGNPTIFILITGTVDNPKYNQLDKKAMQEKVRQDIQTEKQNLKQILNGEFGLFKNDTTLNKKDDKKKEETKFIIDWDEE